MPTTFNEGARERISRSVRYTESQRPQLSGAVLGDRRNIPGEASDERTWQARMDGGQPGGDGEHCDFTYSLWNPEDNPDTDSPIAVEVQLTGNGNGWRLLPTHLRAGTHASGRMNGEVPEMLEIDEGPDQFFVCVEEA